MINIHEVHAQRQARLSKPVKPKFWYWVIYREPFRKHIARHGVKQSDLNYGGVR